MAKAKSTAVKAHEAKIAALVALEDREGRLTAETLVTAARRETHPWHDNFEWDDSKAAHQHRLYTARDIIRTWAPPKITTETVERRAVMYVRDPRRENGEQGYVNVARVRTDEDLKREVLVAEFQRAASALQRAYDVADVLNARAEVEKLIEKINILRQRGEAARI
jgi:hypothetical protein